MYVNFEIAAVFPSPYSRVKRRANFKTNIHLDSVESFLYHLSSNSRISEIFFVWNGLLLLSSRPIREFSNSRGFSAGTN